MSIFSEWDLAYGLTFDALNRKLERVFYQQRGDKHFVKHVVARAIDPAKKGLTGRFLTYVRRPGQYAPGNRPTVEAWYADEKLQQEQVGSPFTQLRAQLTASGTLDSILQPAAPASRQLFYPPSLGIRRQDTNVGWANAVVLTGLGIGNAPLPLPAPTTPMLTTLTNWLYAEGFQPGIVLALSKYFGRSLDAGAREALNKETQKKLADLRTDLSGLPAATTASDVCAHIIKQLLNQVWLKQRFWQSSYLQTLSRYTETNDLTELRQLYAYAVKLRNQPTSAALLASTSLTDLRQAIQPVYQYYKDEEIANLLNEVRFRVKEVFFKRDYDFFFNTLTETTLASIVDQERIECWAEALLEAFACLVPTVVPDLLFGGLDFGGTAARVFAMRLGPCRLECDPTLGNAKFRLVVPVTGGYFWSAADGLQPLHDGQLLTYRIVYDLLFLRLAHKDPAFRIDPANLVTTSYRSADTSTEVSNTTPLVSFAPYTFAQRIADDDATKALLNNQPPAVPDATRYAHEFTYSFLNLFSGLNILDNLPVGIQNNYAAMSWAAVTEYRFLLLQQTNDSGELTGHLYIMGSVHPMGAATSAPGTGGGELAQLRDYGDSLLYISQRLLMQNMFLKNIPQSFVIPLFDPSKTLSLPEFVPATAANFKVTNEGSIVNTTPVYVPYEFLQHVLDSSQQATVNEALDSTRNVRFVIEEGAFKFFAQNNQLVIVIQQASFKKEVVLNDLVIKLTYDFSKRNGLSRYTLLDEQTLGSIELDYASYWAFGVKYGLVLLGILTAVGSAIYGSWTFCQNKNKNRSIVPQKHKPDELKELLAYLAERGSLVGTRIQEPVNADDSSANLVQQIPQLHANRRPWVRGRNRVRRNPARSMSRVGPLKTSNEQLIRDYSSLIFKHMDGEVKKEESILIFPKGHLQDNGLKYDHTYSLRLVKILRPEKGKLRIEAELADAREIKGTGELKNIRKVTLEYTCQESDIRSLEFSRALPIKGKTKAERIINRNLHKLLSNQYDNDYHKLAARERYGELMTKQIKEKFSQEIQETLLHTTYLRHKGYTPWQWFGTLAGGVLASVSGLAAWLVEKHWINGLKDDEAAFRYLLGHHFINEYLRSQFDKLKYPNEEHFSVNRIQIDEDGLKVVMGALESEVLTFAAATPTKQKVGAFVNVRTLTGVRLSLDELQPYNKPASSGTSAAAFTIGFGYNAPDAEGNASFVAVGKSVEFTLTSKGTTWELSRTNIEMAEFGLIGESDTLLVTRLQKPRDEEVNLFSVTLR